LPNILKDGTYGDNIVEIERYFIHTSDGKDLYITEDPNSKIFQDFRQLYCKLISSDNKYRKIINNYKKYYSYVLLNGEYKIIDFGRTIYDKIKHYLNNHDNIDVVFIIGKKMNGIYIWIIQTIFLVIFLSQVLWNFFKKTKSMYIEDIKANNMWTNKRNIDRFIKFLKEYDVDISKIPAIKNEIRQEKLKRILND